MAFSPPSASIWMTAWPVGSSSSTMTWATSTPSAWSPSTSQRPSRPTRPAWATGAPARARAADWFAPLPPAKTR